MKKIALGLLLLSTSAYADRLFYSHDIVTNIHGDYVGGAYLKYKLVWGDDGVANDVSASNPLPVQFSGGIGGITVNQGTTPWVVFDQTLDSDLISFRTANHSDLTLIDSDLLSFKSANHTDLLSVISSIGTGNSSLSSIDSTLTSLNGKVTTTANGIKVDGSAVTQPVSGSVSVSNFPATQPVSGTVTANQGTAGAIAWPVDGSGVTQPVSGTVTANAGTGNFTVVQPTGSNLHVNVDSAPTTSVTQGTSPWVISGSTTVSGTVTSNQGTSPWVVSGTVTANQGSPPWSVSQSGTWTAGRTWTLLNTTDSVNAVQSGVWSTGRTWNLSSGSDSVNVGNFPATQAVTQSTSPWVVSGTVTANAGTGNFTVVQSTGTNLHTVVDSAPTTSVTQGTSPWVVSGTVTSNIGTTGGLALDATLSTTLPRNVSQIGGNAINTGTGVSGTGTQRVAVSSDSSLTLNASSNIIGNVRIDQTTPGTTNGVVVNSGSITANAGTNLNTSALNLETTQSGFKSANHTDLTLIDTDLLSFKTANHADLIATQPRNVSQFGGTNVSTGTGTGGAGIPRVTVSSDSSLTANAGTNLNTSALALSATQTNGTQKTQVVDASGNVQPSGDVLNRKIFTQPTDGTNNQGYTASNEAKVLVTPLTNTSVVKAQLQDNAGTAITVGQKTMSSSVPVVISSDQTGINSFLDKSGTGTISALNGTLSITTNGMSTLDLSAQGTFSATLQVQGQAGDSAWTAVVGYVPGAGNTSTVLTGASNLVFPIGGFSQVRVIAIAYTSGTANIQYNLGSGTQGAQVFNLTPASLQATVAGSGTAGTPNAGVVSVQGVSGGTVIPANVSQLGGNAINTGAGATGTGTARVASNGYDGSGTALTSTTVAGTAANKQPQDVNPLSTGTARYFTAFSTQQTAATVANAAIFTMRNAAAATKTVILESISCRQGFNAASPVTRTQEGYLFQRFSAATPTGGTALTAGQGDSSDAASQMTDIRFLDTGLTTTGVTFVANSLAEMACDTTQGIECTEPILNAPGGWKFAPGEGLVMRLTTATVVGVTIGCHFGWREQ